MNSDKRMAELYAGQSEGNKFMYYNKLLAAWRPHKPEHVFERDTEYKLKPETLDEIIEKLTHRDNTTMWQDLRDLAKWAWANPESKE